MRQPSDAGAVTGEPEGPDPVFVDASGRRARLLRRAGYGAAGLAAGYLSVLALSLMGATPFAPEALLPPLPGESSPTAPLRQDAEGDDRSPEEEAGAAVGPGSPLIPLIVGGRARRARCCCRPAPIPGASPVCRWSRRTRTRTASRSRTDRSPPRNPAGPRSRTSPWNPSSRVRVSRPRPLTAVVPSRRRPTRVSLRSPVRTPRPTRQGHRSPRPRRRPRPRRLPARRPAGRREPLMRRRPHHPAAPSPASSGPRRHRFRIVVPLVLLAFVVSVLAVEGYTSRGFAGDEEGRGERAGRSGARVPRQVADGGRSSTPATIRRAPTGRPPERSC